MAADLNDVLTEVVDGIKLALPALPTCKTHSGRFGLEEVKRLANAAPAVLVSCLRLQANSHPVIRWSATCAVFVLTRDLVGLPRDVSARSLSAYLCGWLRGRQFSGCHAVSSVDAQNLYAGDLEKIGISLWGITWMQSLESINPAESHGGNEPVPLLMPSQYYTT